jgi:L-iditol 2-dehydrogenase
MRRALELIGTAAIDPRPLISHRLPLEQTGRALDLQRTGGGLKAVVLP